MPANTSARNGVAFGAGPDMPGMTPGAADQSFVGHPAEADTLHHLMSDPSYGFNHVGEAIDFMDAHPQIHDVVGQMNAPLPTQQQPAQQGPQTMQQSRYGPQHMGSLEPFYPNGAPTMSSSPHPTGDMVGNPDLYQQPSFMRPAAPQDAYQQALSMLPPDAKPELTPRFTRIASGIGDALNGLGQLVQSRSRQNQRMIPIPTSHYSEQIMARDDAEKARVAQQNRGTGIVRAQIMAGHAGQVLDAASGERIAAGHDAASRYGADQRTENERIKAENDNLRVDQKSLADERKEQSLSSVFGSGADGATAHGIKLAHEYWKGESEDAIQGHIYAALGRRADSDREAKTKDKLADSTVGYRVDQAGTADSNARSTAIRNGLEIAKSDMMFEYDEPPVREQKLQRALDVSFRAINQETPPGLARQLAQQLGAQAPPTGANPQTDSQGQGSTQDAPPSPEQHAASIRQLISLMKSHGDVKSFRKQNGMEDDAEYKPFLVEAYNLMVQEDAANAAKQKTGVK
jgi:hypothetical protein